MQLTNRKMTKNRVIAAFMLVALTIAAASTNIYFIWEGNGGTALWNASEADLFISSYLRGNRVSYLTLPWFLLIAYFGASPPPDDERDSVIVVRATASGIKKYVVPWNSGPGAGPDWYTPIHERIWANFSEFGGLCWWARDHFELASAEEQARLHGRDQLTSGSFQRNQDGWSRQTIGSSLRNETKSVDVGDRLKLVIKSSVTQVNKDGIFTVDALYPSGPSEKIVELDPNYRRVSRTEYLRAFSVQPRGALPISPSKKAP